jgi:secreted Zn-dependent insulinase-like peptidase
MPQRGIEITNRRQEVFTMAELTWEKNSKAMFDKCIEGSPKPFRAMTEKKLTEAITKKAGDAAVVTEDMIIECVKEITPKPFVAMALKAIEPLKTA